MLVALFGDKGTVDRYTTFEALEVLSADRDSDAASAHISHHYGLIKEEQARNRGK